MKTPAILLLACAVIAAPAAAFASTPAFQNQPTADANAKPAGTAVAEKGDTKKICRKLKVSGTRFAEKVCMTKAEWAKVEAETRA